MELFKKSSFAGGAVFAALFLMRLLYGLLVEEDEKPDLRFESFEFARKNYASEKQQAGKDAALLSSQKYEKVATMSARSMQFEKDEQELRTRISDLKAVIQLEQNSGLPGRRVLHLAIGVHPDRFDAMIAASRAIGTLISINVNKTDKTSEFKDLNAKRISLEKYRQGLLSLKGHNGKIEELISLEQKILEIEKEIQDMGVKLGEFDAENEFCTVKVSLYEGGLPASGAAWFGRVVLESLLFAGLWSLGISFFLVFCAGTLWFSLRFLERVRDFVLRVKQS
jgi:hypothetical protein